MKQFEIQKFGVENLAFVEVDAPRPKYGQVLVRMRAASLNFRDTLVVKGAYNPKMKLPMTPLSDGSGVVEEVGEGVTQWKKGDRVTGCFFNTWADGPPSPAKVGAALGGSVPGVLREFSIFPEEGIIASPASLSDEEAATLPCAALTAWHALFEDKPALPGETVLIQGTGGVSVFALQFAVSAGLRTIVTSSSDEKLARARQLGASDTINYKTTSKWEEVARKLTRGEGVDRVIEVGGSGTLPRSLQAVRMAGSVSMIGVLSGVESTLSPLPVLMNSIRVQGVYVGSRAMFQRMSRAIEQHRIKPVIDKTFEWTEVKQALQYMETGQHFGKICLRWI
jgi:NADPH:quinone reductase-like Zn-dependent oxidoreductase